MATNTLLVTTNTLLWTHGLSEAPGTVLVPPQEGVRSGYTHPPPEPRVEFVPSQEGVRSGYEHPPQHLELRLRVLVGATNTLLMGKNALLVARRGLAWAQ